MIQLPNLPEPVQWVALAVAGDRFPEGNEDELNRLADLWADLGDTLSQSQPELANRLAAVSASYGGAAGMEFLFASHDLLGSGRGDGMAQLVEAAMRQHMTVKLGAMDIALTKAAIVMEVIATAIAVLWAIMSAKFTLGLSGLSVPHLIVAGRQAVGRMVAELVGRLASRGGAHTFRRLSARGARQVLREGVQEAAEEVAIAAGAGFLAGDGRNGERILRAGTAGFFGGAGGTLIFGPRFFGLSNRFAGADIRTGGWRSIGTASGLGLLQNPVSSGIGGSFAEGLAGNGFTVPWSMGWEGALGAALVGGFRAGLTRSGGIVGTRLSPVRVDPVTGLVTPRPGGTPLRELNPFQSATSFARGGSFRVDPAVAPLLTEAQRETIPEVVATGRLAQHAGVAAAPAQPLPARAEPAYAGPARPVALLDAPAGLAGVDGVEIAYAVPGSDGRVHVGATITDSGGEPIGSLTRVYGRQGLTVYVEHVSTLIAKDLPSTERLRLDQLFGEVEESYRRAGVREIRLPARTVEALDGAAAAHVGLAPAVQEGDGMVKPLAAAAAPPAPQAPPAPPQSATPYPPEPGWPTADQAVEELQGLVGGDRLLADLVSDKVAELRRLATADRDLYQFLLAAGFTVAEAGPVVAGEVDAVDAALTRLRIQEDALADLLQYDRDLTQTAEAAGVTGDLSARAGELMAAREAALARNAAVDAALATAEGAARQAVSDALAQVQAALVEQMRSDLIGVRLAAAGVPKPAADPFARQVMAATASGVRPELRPLAEAVAASIQNRLVEGGVLPGTAESLAGQLAELVMVGARVTTVHAVIDGVVDQLHRRDPQDSVEALGGALGLAWEMASNEPAPPAGALVDAVAAAGIVDDVNSALGHRRLAVRSRRGSVQLARPVHGVGSGRRFSLSVSAGFLPHAATVTVAEGTGPSRVDHQNGQAVVRLDPTSSVEAANAFIARAVAASIDDLRAAGRWRRRPGAAVPERTNRGILHTGPLPEEFQRKPRTRTVTATDVVELNLRVNRPAAKLAALEERQATVDPGDPARATVLATRDAALSELREGAAELGLTGAAPPTGANPDTAAIVAGLAGYVPPEVTEGLTQLDQEIAAELTITGRLRTLLTGAGMSWHRAQELVEWVSTAGPEQRTARTWRLLRELPGLPDSQIALLRFRRQVETLMAQLSANLDRQRRRTVRIVLSGMLGKAAAHAVAAGRNRAHANAVAEALHTELTRSGEMSAASAPIYIDRVRGAGGEAVVELLPDGSQRDLAILLRRLDATAAVVSAAVPGLVAKVANRTADIRWDRVDRWLDHTLRAGQGRWVMQDALGRPPEPLGLPPRRWHMLRRAGGIASAAGLGVAMAGPFGWATAAAAAGLAAAAPIVSGFAGRAYDAGVRVTELHRSYPDPGQALRRRVPAAVVLVAARAVGRSVTALSPPLREGLRGWRDVFAARAWAVAHAEYAARSLYKGEVPSEYNEPVMDRMDQLLGRVAEALATTRHARFREVRSGPTDTERAQLHRLAAELQQAAEQLEATARQRKRRYAAQRLDRLRNRPPKGLPSGWTHQRRRAPISALTGAADRALGALAEDPQAGAATVVESSGGQSLALAEKWVAVRRYRADSGMEAAVMSRRVREYAAATRRLRDGVPERPGLHRPRNDPAHWPIYRRRGMPDYAAHALRAHTATGGHAMAYLAWAGLGNWRARQLSSLVSKALPKVPTSSVLIGAGSTMAFGLLTKSLDWRYREVKERAALRQRMAQLLRARGGAQPPLLGGLPGEVAELRSMLERQPAGTATAVPLPVTHNAGTPGFDRSPPAR